MIDTHGLTVIQGMTFQRSGQTVIVRKDGVGIAHLTYCTDDIPGITDAAAQIDSFVLRQIAKI